MKVSQLIKRLEKMPKHLPVMLCDLDSKKKDINIQTIEESSEINPTTVYITFESNKDYSFMADDIDAAYLMGVFISGGIDSLQEVVTKISEGNLRPHEVIRMLKHAEK